MLRERDGTPARVDVVPGMRVAVVLVNWNGWRECIECLDTLLPQAHDSFHVFVVDNASTDGSVERIVAWCHAPTADASWRRHCGVARLTDRSPAPPVQCRIAAQSATALPAPQGGCRLTIVRCTENRGFAAGCNRGMVAAGLGEFDYFWLLNPDTTVAQHALTELLARAAASPRVGMVGSTIRYYDRPEIVEALGGARLDRSSGATSHIGQGERADDTPVDAAAVEREMAYVMGASMLVRATFVREVGLMQEDYFLYFEEIDWVLRARGRFLLGFAPRSQVFHKSGANSRKAAPLLSTRFYYRNRLRFVARFMPEHLTAAKWQMVKDMLRQIARGQWPYVRIVLSTLINAGSITAGVVPYS